MLEQSRAVSTKAAEKARVNAWASAKVKETIEKVEQRTLDTIFAGKKTVTRANAERRLSAKRGGGR